MGAIIQFGKNSKRRMISMDKIKVLGKEYIPNMPDEFPVEDFEEFLENYKQYPDLEPDFLDMLEEFAAVVFIKNNKDLFVKMMVEDIVKLRREHARCWFERNMPFY